MKLYTEQFITDNEVGMYHKVPTKLGEWVEGLIGAGLIVGFLLLLIYII